MTLAGWRHRDSPTLQRVLPIAVACAHIARKQSSGDGVGGVEQLLRQRCDAAPQSLPLAA
jgi:hypothetical protein